MFSRRKSNLEMMIEDQYSDNDYLRGKIESVREMEDERNRKLGLYHPESEKKDRTNGWSL